MNAPVRRFITWRGFKAEVDPEVYQELSRYAWNAFVTHCGKVYFRRTAADGRTTLLLHREAMRLLGIEPAHPKMVLVDHIDGNELDCRKSNMRWATYSQNSLNRKKAA